MSKRKLEEMEINFEEKRAQDDRLGLEVPAMGDGGITSVSGTLVIPPSPMATIRLSRTFFDQSSCLELAKNLLGKLLIRKISPNVFVSARIVETEAYLGGDDKASHSYQGKKTNKNAAMFMTPGTAYVYSIHTYVCFNISAKEHGAAVLIRACEPVSGSNVMTSYRAKRRNPASADTSSWQPPVFKLKDLCNGPSKLCLSLDITKELFNRTDLSTCDELYLAEDGFGNVPDEEITSCPRIGIGNYAEEWTDKHLRFYITNNAFVSVKYKDKKK